MSVLRTKKVRKKNKRGGSEEEEAAKPVKQAGGNANGAGAGAGKGAGAGAGKGGNGKGAGAGTVNVPLPPVVPMDNFLRGTNEAGAQPEIQKLETKLARTQDPMGGSSNDNLINTFDGLYDYCVSLLIILEYLINLSKLYKLSERKNLNQEKKVELEQVLRSSKVKEFNKKGNNGNKMYNTGSAYLIEKNIKSGVMEKIGNYKEHEQYKQELEKLLILKRKIETQITLAKNNIENVNSNSSNNNNEQQAGEEAEEEDEEETEEEAANKSINDYINELNQTEKIKLLWWYLDKDMNGQLDNKEVNVVMSGLSTDNMKDEETNRLKGYLSSFYSFIEKWNIVKEYWNKLEAPEREEISNIFNDLKFSKNNQVMGTVDDKFKISLVDFITNQDKTQFKGENNIFTQTGIYVQNIEKREYVLNSKERKGPKPITDKTAINEISKFFPPPKT